MTNKATQIRVILPGYNTQVLNEEMLRPYQSTELILSVDYANIPVDAVRHEFDMALIFSIPSHMFKIGN